MGLSWVTVAEDRELETPKELREIFRQSLVGTAGHKELGAPEEPHGKVGMPGAAVGLEGTLLEEVSLFPASMY